MSNSPISVTYYRILHTSETNIQKSKIEKRKQVAFFSKNVIRNDRILTIDSSRVCNMADFEADHVLDTFARPGRISAEASQMIPKRKHKCTPR